MTLSFEEVFSKIKDLETNNKQKINRTKDDSKKNVVEFRQKKNVEKIEKIEKIDEKFEKYFNDEKKKIDEIFQQKRNESDGEIKSLAANLEKNVEKAIEFLETKI